MKSKILIAAGILVVLSLLGFLTYQLTYARSRIDSLQNELSQVSSAPIVVAADTLGYLKYAELVSKIQSSTADLQQLVRDQHLRLSALIETQMQIGLRLDSIKTHFSNDSTERLFDESLYGGSVRFRGRYQLHSPYLLFVDSLGVYFPCEISVARNSRGALISTVTGLPPFASVHITKTLLDKSVYGASEGNQSYLRQGLYLGPFIGRFEDTYSVGVSAHYTFYNFHPHADFFSKGWGMGLSWRLR